VKEIQKLPPEAQPAALSVALGSIGALREAADAFVQALPGLPHSLSTTEIKTNAARLILCYQHADKNSSLKIFKPGLKLLREVEEMVNPLGDDPPTIPHQLAVPFINHQAEFLHDYVLKNVLK
jgi:nitrate reductase cytochrome c-type subunit